MKTNKKTNLQSVRQNKSKKSAGKPTAKTVKTVKSVKPKVKPASKKAKKPVAKKTVKSVPKKTVAKKPVAKKTATKKPVPKKTAAGKTTAKKPTAKKVVYRKSTDKVGDVLVNQAGVKYKITGERYAAPIGYDDGKLKIRVLKIAPEKKTGLKPFETNDATLKYYRDKKVLTRIKK